MGKTFKDRKIHRGQIQKAINEEENRKKELIQKETEEQKRWHDPKSISNSDLRKQKEQEKLKRKEELKRKYEEEHNNM